MGNDAVQPEWTRVAGYAARCGDADCNSVLHFSYSDSMILCGGCSMTYSLSGAYMEYRTLVLRIGNMTAAVDDVLNEYARRGWVVDKMDVSLDPTSNAQIVVVYLLRRLVAKVIHIGGEDSGETT